MLAQGERAQLAAYIRSTPQIADSLPLLMLVIGADVLEDDQLEYITNHAYISSVDSAF